MNVQADFEVATCNVPLSHHFYVTEASGRVHLVHCLGGKISGEGS